MPTAPASQRCSPVPTSSCTATDPARSTVSASAPPSAGLSSPGLIDVCLDAYGWTGPWAMRRGFDSLVQMSCGIAEAGQVWRGADEPVPLPVQALDHATGYLLAAAAIRLLDRRVREGRGGGARLSLARTAGLLLDGDRAPSTGAFAPEAGEDFARAIEETAWGPARRLRPPLTIEGAPMAWALAARRLGTDPAAWAGAAD